MKYNINNIILIGNSGSGKSTLGFELSKILKKDFFDSDLEIEKKLNININNIFKKYGEFFFRKEETKIIKKILNKDNFILSTGAGVITSKENINILTKNGLIIYLKSNIKDCLNRIIKFKNRPLLYKYNEKKYNNKKNIEKIFKEREFLYEKISNITIDTNKKTINFIIKDILYILKNKINI